MYAITSGERTWENTDGWDEGIEDLNEWWGVSLSRMEPRKLIRLKLVDNGLEGILPDSLNVRSTKKASDWSTM